MTEWLVHFLRSIPQSNQDARRLAELAGTEPDGEMRAQLHGAALLLCTLGIVEYDADTELIRASAQTAKYALESLASYAENQIPVVGDWKTRGVLRDPEGGLLQNGATFLHALELRRLALLHDARPSRVERVAMVIIKRSNPTTSAPELLFQWDRNARQFQLIGGRWRESDGPDLLRTMEREIAEELEPADMVHGQDYHLSLLIPALQLPPSLSPTFGALTTYEFGIYHMTELARPLRLQAEDHWLPLADVLAGTVLVEGEAVHFARQDLYHAIDAACGGIAALADTASSAH